MLGTAWGTAIGAFGVFITPLEEEMRWSRAGVSIAFSINIAVTFIVGIFWGWLSDRWSVRGVLGVTGVIMGLGLFLTAMSTSLWQMYIFYGVIVGIGLGGTGGPLTAIVVRWFPMSPGMALGIIYSGFGAASAVVPILAERLISSYGWRFGFEGLSYLIWGAFFVGVILLREPRPLPSSSAPATQVAKPEANPEANPEGDPALAGQPRSSTSAQGVSDDALSMDLRAASRTRAFWTLFAMMFVGDLVLNMVLVHLVPRVEDAGIASATAVTLLTVTGFVNMVSTMAGGLMGDRFGARRVYFASLLLLAIAMMWLIASSKLWMFYIFAVAFGMANGGWFPQGPVLAARIYGARYMGSICAGLFLGAGIGGVIGPIVAGYVFDTLDSYQIAFVMAIAVTFVGLLLTALLSDRPMTRTASAIAS